MCDVVSDDLVIGRRLRKYELLTGVVNYVDLTCEFEDPVEIRKTLHYIALPILDAGIPTAKAVDEMLAKLKPGRTYIHCAQGYGRTGVVALAFLAKRQQIQSYEQGLKLLQNARPKLTLNRRQQVFIEDFINKTISDQAFEQSPDRD